MTLPDKPTSRNQRYRRTSAGEALARQLTESSKIRLELAPASRLVGVSKTDYFAAIQAGMSTMPMKGLVRRVLRETARNVDD